MSPRSDAKVWDICISCGDDLDLSTEQDWRNCLRRSQMILCTNLALIGSVLALWIIFFSRFGLDDRHFKYHMLGAIGLTTDIAGGWMLATGYSDIQSIAAGAWGGGHDTLKQFGYAGLKKRLAGLLLLSVGFLFQSFAYLVS